MELKVNDYVRTKSFGIKKVKYFENEEPILENGFTALQSDGYKSSPNIGKLLKVGDFIDGMRIIEIENTTIHTLGGWFIDIDDVEDLVTSIVTKEQFEQMEYKIN